MKGAQIKDCIHNKTICFTTNTYFPSLEVRVAEDDSLFAKCSYTGWRQKQLEWQPRFFPT